MNSHLQKTSKYSWFEDVDFERGIERITYVALTCKEPTFNDKPVVVLQVMALSETKFIFELVEQSLCDY